jgi:hypothetical protein
MDVIQQVNSNANKALLWSLLTEERVFAGLSDSSLQPVMTLFETAIHTTINSYAQETSSSEKQNSSPQMVLSTLNKEVIKRVMTEMAQYKPPSTASLVPIYKSNDIQEARIRDITSKVKVLEDDMNSLLVLKKPAEIDFSDKKINDDVPIGENMDELIKQALASRERELELIQFDIPNPTPTPTPTPAGGRQAPPLNPLIVKEGYGEPLVPWATATSTASSTPSSNRKSVSFDTDNNNDTGADMEIGTIFNKLKRPTMTTTPATATDALNAVNAVNINVNDDKLDSILKSIHSLYEIVNDIAKDVRYIKEKYTA